jgi:hypothetical protein
MAKGVHLTKEEADNMRKRVEDLGKGFSFARDKGSIN